MKKKLYQSLSKKIKSLKPWQIILGVVGVVLVAIYIYSIVGTSDVVLSVSSLESKVVVGVPFEIKANIKNISRSEISNTRLSLTLPSGLIFVDAPGLRISAIDLGKVEGNGKHEETYKVVAIPTANVSMVEPVATLSYSRGSVKGRFEQKEILPIEVADLGIDLQLTGPEKIISSEQFTLRAVYSRGSLYTSETEDIPVLKLQFDYPSALVPTYSVPKPTESNVAATKLDAKTFTIGVLKPGASGEVDLKGIVDLPEGSDFKITANVLINIMGRDYALVSKDFVAALAPAPLSVRLYAAVGDEPDPDDAKAVIKAGDEVNYLLVYKNQSDIAFDNVILKVKLTGLMYDFNSVEADNASWDNAAKTIAWDRSDVDDFKSLPPGASGNLNFTVRLISDFPIRRLNDKNFTVKAEARIESPTVQKKVSAAKTSSSFALENKVAGQIKVDSLGFFRDAAALILNNGPWPPRVNQPTEFTIHWVLTNYSTDVTNIDVRAQLPDGYEFTGIVKSNVSSVPQFDADKGEVYWKIDKLYATQGITSESPEAIFQVRIIPFAAGDYAPIVGETTVTALDSFTGAQITSVDDAITTRLPDDHSVKENDGKVVN